MKQRAEKTWGMWKSAQAADVGASMLDLIEPRCAPRVERTGNGFHKVVVAQSCSTPPPSQSGGGFGRYRRRKRQK